MSFRSKIDTSMVVFGIITVGTLITGLISTLSSGENFFTRFSLSILFGIVILYFVFMFVNTRYVITNQDLIIWDSFIKRKIPINEINQINNVSDLISSPALSLDRIEIIHHQNKKLYVSPMNKVEFVKTLKTYNVNILLDERLQT
ncbi:PH domain-containing protein [Bacillus sp. RG28]|uniref:PH domain-containing protein n=1 Tax=Gottfriedia endophytica TaxID=2820819 RepID=A0A940NM21_9BACI|nr:PH domain-containing protein [Gottfriedia endophytica]MBP0726955.1 PH domain-containing protein [Gottfriedia endophytica]